MAITFKAQYAAVNTDDTQDRVEMAMVRKALVLVTGTQSTLRRYAWNILTNSKGYKEELSKAVISTVDKALPTDTEISNALDTLIPYFALGESVPL